MSYREHINREEKTLLRLKSNLCINDLSTCSIWHISDLLHKSAALIKIWRNRLNSGVGSRLLKICDYGLDIKDDRLVDFVLSVCINPDRRRCKLCRQKESKSASKHSHINARLDHTAQCQSWASSIVAYRVIEKLFESDHFEHLMQLLDETNRLLIDQTRNGLIALGGGVLPFSLQNEIIKKSLYMDRFNSANSPEMKRIAIAAYLLYDSLFVLLGGATGLEDPLTWSPLSYLSRLNVLERVIRPNGKSTIVPSEVDASIAPCVYSWPWVAVKLSSQLSIHNVDSGLIIKFESEPVRSLDHISSFCVCRNFICVVELGGTSGGVNVYSRDGAFLYKIKLNDLSTNFDPADQPIRIFQKSPNTDHVLLVIERENNLLPSIHQEIGVIALHLYEKKSDVISIDTTLRGGGALLDFHADSYSTLSIWHPNCHEDKNDEICPVNSEIVQIRSSHGTVLRSVSPRVKPKSYKCHSAAQLTRHYKINENGDHFCEISHAGRLVRVSEAKGEVLFELNPDVALHWERQDSRILAADVNWPRLLLLIEYAECIGTYHGEQQAAFQTVLLGDIQNGEFVNVTVLEVSRNDAQYGEVVDELDRTVPNRNPDGETSLQLPVHLNAKQATVVYANHTIFVHQF